MLRSLVEVEHPLLGISEQCRILGLPRSSFYHQPLGESAENLALMRQLDELFTRCPFYGVRRIWANLPDSFSHVNIKRVRRLLRLMGVLAIYPPLNTQKTSISDAEHEKYPYLLRGLKIERPNQVWSTDITYVPMANGFLYLCAVMDWYSRFVLSWTISNTLSTDFCVEALQLALEKGGKPDIFNTDQGSQFTAKRFIEVLKEGKQPANHVINHRS